jgi:AcrR family transcriptional regulator
MTPAQGPVDAARPMRADARRNSELLIATAREVFAEKGAEAPLDEIAKRAGVGAGTLYRHFPNRDALVEAVYRGEVSELADRASALLAEYPPDVALAEWMRAQVRFISHRHGLAMSLKATLSRTSETMVWCKNRLLGSAEELLDAAIHAGAVRADLEPYDLLRLGHGIAVAAELGSESDGERLIEVMLNGLRTSR